MRIAGISVLLAWALGLGGCTKHTDYWINGMEVVQASQTSILNSVPMVADKPTFVRVYVQSYELAKTWKLSAVLNVHNVDTGSNRTLTPVNFTAVTAPTSGSRRDLWNGSFTFWLNSADTEPGERKFDAHVYAVSEPSPPPADHQWSIQILFHPRVEEQVYGVVWSVTDNSDGTPLGAAAPWSDFSPHVSFVRNVFPVSKFSVVPIPGIGMSPPVPQTFRNLTESRTWATTMLATLPANSKINLLDNWDTGGLHGYAWGLGSEEQNVLDNRVGKTMAQEVSHNNGLWCHTQDPCDNYPNANGQIDQRDIGFNLSGDLGRSDIHLVSWYSERDFLDQETAKGAVGDIMSYNNPPMWISSYTYCQEMGVLWTNRDFACSYAASQAEPRAGQITGQSRSNDLRQEQSQDRAQEGMLVAGFLDARHAAHFDAIDVLPFDVGRGWPKRKDLFLELLDSSGDVVSRAPANAVSHAEGKFPFAAILPLDPGKGRPVTVRLRKGETVLGKQALATRNPTVSLTPLADQELHGTETLRWSARDPENRPLRFAILFSRDNRNNWQGLNAGITKTEAPLNSDFLPGTDSAWFKIRASNQGTSTESAPIGPYRIRPKPPTISIDAPAEDTTIEAGTPVLVSCTAFSWQDGLITAPRSFAWHVDGRSIPGGSWTVIRNLAAGPHAVRASVHDSAGRNASATLRLLVETDQKYLPAR